MHLQSGHTSSYVCRVPQLDDAMLRLNSVGDVAETFLKLFVGSAATPAVFSILKLLQMFPFAAHGLEMDEAQLRTHVSR